MARIVPWESAASRYRVGLPRLFRRGGRLVPLPAQFGVQGDHVLKNVIGHTGPHLQVWQAKRGVGRVVLRLLDRDLKLGTTTRRLAAQQLAGRHRQCASERVEQGKLRFPAPILEQGERGGRTSYPLAKIG